MKHKLRGFLVHKMPVGIAVSPFEFAILLGYTIASTKLIVELSSHSQDILIKALPFKGTELLLWLILLLIGSLTGAAGLLLTGRRPVYLGLQVERAGLFLVGALITTYLAGIADLIGWTAANLTLVATFFQVLAFAYKIVQISQALASRPKE